MKRIKVSIEEAGALIAAGYTPGRCYEIARRAKTNLEAEGWLEAGLTVAAYPTASRAITAKRRRDIEHKNRNNTPSDQIDWTDGL